MIYYPMGGWGGYESRFISFAYDCSYITGKLLGFLNDTYEIYITNDLFIYLGFYVAFNIVQVISRQVVRRAEETSTYSWSRFCTVNCRLMANNNQLSHLKLGRILRMKMRK